MRKLLIILLLISFLSLSSSAFNIPFIDLFSQNEQAITEIRETSNTSFIYEISSTPLRINETRILDYKVVNRSNFLLVAPSQAIIEWLPDGYDQRNSTYSATFEVICVGTSCPTIAMPPITTVYENVSRRGREQTLFSNTSRVVTVRYNESLSYKKRVYQNWTQLPASLVTGTPSAFNISGTNDKYSTNSFNITFAGSLSLSIDPAISACGTLLTRGEYTFTQNVHGAGTVECITISAAHVVINGNGTTLRNNGSGNGINMQGFGNITLRGLNIANFTSAIVIGGTQNSTIWNNTLETTNKSDSSGQVDSIIGILSTTNSRLNISNNTFTQISNGSWGISPIEHSYIGYNEFLTNVTGAQSIVNGNNNTVVFNNFTSRTTVGTISNIANSTITNNKFYSITTGINRAVTLWSNNTVRYNHFTADAPLGTVIYGVNASLIEENVILGIGGVEGIQILANQSNNRFVNNNITTNNTEIEDRSDADSPNTLNYLIYNNSYGQIVWIENRSGAFLDDMQVNVNNGIGLGIGKNIVINDNVTAINGSAFTDIQSTILSAANITIEGMTFPSINTIAKLNGFETDKNVIINDGFNCNGTTCFMYSYAGGKMVFNTTNLSSFTGTNASISPVSCGTLTSNLTLDGNVESNGTCFTIGANNVLLDCRNFNITHSNLGGDNTYGVTKTTYNSTTIKNCGVVEGNVSGQNKYGIIATNGNNDTIENNTFWVISNSTAYLSSSSSYSVITGNRVFASGANSGGIWFIHSNSSIVKENIINSTASFINLYQFGQNAGDTSNNNTLLNNNISTTLGAGFISDQTLDSTINYLIYNNSFGEIKWIDNGSGSFLRNLTLDLVNSDGFGLGKNLFIGNNSVAINLSAFDLDFTNRINSTTNITLNGLNFSFVDRIYSLPSYSESANTITTTGTNCITSGICVNLSYVNSTGTLIFNTTQLGSFAANFTPAGAANNSVKCGTVNFSTTLTNDILVNGSCFLINASNIVLDGGLYNLIGNGSFVAINSTGSFNNVTIKNFANIRNFTNGFYAQSGTQNWTFFNNSIHTTQHTIQFNTAHHGWNISNNFLKTTGTGFNTIFASNGGSRNIIFNNQMNISQTSDGIPIGAENHTLVLFNQINIYGTGSNGILMDARGINNTVFGNTINSTSTSNGIQIAGRMVNNTINNNSIFVNSGYGIGTNDFVDDIYLINNLVNSSTGIEYSDLNISGGKKILIFNNSFGEIVWTNKSFQENLTVRVNNPFGLGISTTPSNNLVIANNTIALNLSSINLGYINSSVNLSLRGINLHFVKQIKFLPNFSDNQTTIQQTGTDCISSGICTNISYNNITGTLIFNATQMGSFSANGSAVNNSISCGTINFSTTLTNDIYTTGSCFQINASNIFIDGLGYSVQSNGFAESFGVNGTNFTNVTIKNIKFNNFTVSVRFINMTNSLIFNSTLITTTQLSSAHSVRFTDVRNTNITFNLINTTSSDSSAIILETGSNNITVNRNDINTNSSGAENIIILTANSSIIRNNILFTRGSAVQQIIISQSSFFHNISENNITATDGDTNNIVFSIGSGNNIVENNNLTSSSKEIEDTTTSAFTNYLQYSNSFGLVQWANTSYIQDLDLNVTNGAYLGLGSNLFIGNNTLAVNVSGMDVQRTRVNSTVNLTLVGLNFVQVGQIFFTANFSTEASTIIGTGVECISSGFCTNISYNNATGTLVFNSSQVGSFAANSSSSLDVFPPFFYNITFNPTNQSTYIPLRTYFFNATIQDETAIGNIVFQFNGVNYTNFTRTLSTNVYTWNVTPLAGGQHNFTWLANDSSGNRNNTGALNYTILQNTSTEVNLTFQFNGSAQTDTSIRIEVGTTINETGTRIIGDDVLRIWDGGVIVANGTAPTVASTYNTVGTFSVNLTHESNNNYTATNETHYVVVVDSSRPFIEFRPNTTFSGTNTTTTTIIANVSATDNNLSTIVITLYNSTGIVRNETNTTSPFYTNFSALPEGVYRFNATANDTYGNINATETRTVIIDLSAPNFHNFTEQPTDQATYAPNQTYFFNITIQENLTVLNTVILEFQGVNYSNVTRQGTQNKFTVNITDLNASTYTYRWFANDSVGNMGNATSTYLIGKNNSLVNLSFNGTFGNITVQVGSAVRENGTILWGENQIQLLEQDVVINTGISPIFNITRYNTVGYFNVSVYHPESPNYNRSNVTYYITVVDTSIPYITFIPPTPANHTNTSNVNLTINVSASDNNLSTIIITLYNSTGIVGNATDTTSTFDFNFTNLLDGHYNFNATATDANNTQNSTHTFNFTVDTRPPFGVTNLGVQGQTAFTITWNWTNPTSDFFYSILYLNGTIVANISDGNRTYTATGLQESASYNLTIHTRDYAQNLNNTDITNITSTAAATGGGSGGGGGGGCRVNETLVNGSCLPIPEEEEEIEEEEEEIIEESLYPLTFGSVLDLFVDYLKETSAKIKETVGVRTYTSIIVGLLFALIVFVIFAIWYLFKKEDNRGG